MDFKMKLILLTVPAWVSAKVYSGCSIPVNSKDGKRKRLTCPQEPWGLQHSHHSWEKMHRETGFELAILLPQPLEPLGLQGPHFQVNGNEVVVGRYWKVR
ncbi:uncharacterized protein LOC144378064 isoform X2 [Ictidomys tridecemlineatus]